MRNIDMRKALSLLILFLFMSASLAFAALNDAFSLSYWQNKTGIYTKSVNALIDTYLGDLGYTGSLMDKYHKWLADETGISSTRSFNDLAYEYFVLGTRAGGSGELAFNGSLLTFNGSQLTFNR